MHKKDNHILIQVHAFSGERYLLHYLVVGIVFTIFGYAYFVSLSIFNVIAHKEAIAQSDRLQSQVGLLEEQYFALSKEVTPALAARLGMAPTAKTTFVRRPGAVGSAQQVRGL